VGSPGFSLCRQHSAHPKETSSTIVQAIDGLQLEQVRVRLGCCPAAGCLLNLQHKEGVGMNAVIVLFIVIVAVWLGKRVCDSFEER
jgi:hypothetical protein